MALTEAVGARFGLTPYGGEYGPEPVPHLTVAHDAPAARLRAVADELARGLPVTTRIENAVLLVEDGGWWSPHSLLPLGTRSGSGATIDP